MQDSAMDTSSYARPPFDVLATRRRCTKMRKRILDVSQKLGALHIAPAFSCMQLVNTSYFGLMRPKADGSSCDTFVLSEAPSPLVQSVSPAEVGGMPPVATETCSQPGGAPGR